MTDIGAIFLPQNPPERVREVVRVAEDSGLAELWFWEDCFLESGIATASAALAWSDRLTVGVGLLPVPLRNVALVAMEVATLQRLFPGRILAGVGHGVQEWMHQVGARAESPLTLLREHLTALRALLHGEEVTTDGRYVRLDRVALDWPPSPPPPVLAGATGPKTLRLCGELSDGVILTSESTLDDVRRARELIEEGANRFGRDAAPPITAYLSTRSGDAPATAGSVRDLVDAGAGKVILEPTTDDDPDAFVRFAAQEVAPLLAS
ncbi:LLM class flavin-dependent oxidoreductase [Nocardioidaceae bacterium SCSIO 66511]|nr:LLM class flavin-dependent oxidoreductase [Nocardioidaceae bacterium SCSIO 66511]